MEWKKGSELPKDKTVSIVFWSKLFNNICFDQEATYVSYIHFHEEDSLRWMLIEDFLNWIKPADL
jgi:hypothetical protein